MARTIKLYQFGNSVCCQKVRITLLEKKLDWDPIEVNLFSNEQYSPEYLKLNPAGVVPTLVHDGNVVTESTLICEYLDELYPVPKLMPAAPLGRTEMRRWSKMVDEGLHEGVSEISFSAMFRERMKSMTEEERRVRFDNVGDPRRRDRFRSTFELGAHSPFVRYAIASFEKMFRRLEANLEKSSPWIMGDAITLADINLMPYVARLDYLGLLDLWIEERPRTRAWWRQAVAWPTFQAGVHRAMRDGEIAEMSLHGPKLRPDIAGILVQLRAAAAH